MFTPLSDTFANNIKHAGLSVFDKHTDGGGMYLMIHVSRKCRRINFRFIDKRKTLALSLYPGNNHG